MVSEYRALRASVIRLWSADSGTLTGADLKDLTRFNEAIDQALAESVSRFTQDLDRSKEMFIAILGQDLRAPLNAVTTGARDLLKGNLDEKQAAVTLSISRSGNRMNEMIDDLLDFTRGRLGSGLPIERADVDLGAVVLHAVDEMRAAHPDATLQMTSAGDLRGSWDGARVSQALTNLLGNAVQHGEPGAMISVTLQGEAREVVIRVHNHGVAIPASEIPHLFSPFTQSGRRVAQTPESTSLGLGLYIAERIVTAHGGSISVRSSGEAGTLFTTRLPR